MLVSVWEVSKVKPEELADHPESPPHFPWVWEWFFDFNSPITWPDIKAWSDIYGLPVARWEGELLVRMDILRNQ